MVADPAADPDRTVTAARSLFQLLFPAEARREVERARRLLISPDGVLWDVPFAALVTNDAGPPRYLGAERGISFTPSLTLFAQCRQERLRSGRADGARTVALGDPVFGHEKTRLTAAAPLDAERQRSERFSLLREGEVPPRLPATREEAARIAHLYGSAPLLGSRATEAALRRQIGQAEVIHLATHGYLHPTRPMSSGVLLTPPVKAPPVGETGNDGALQAWEIFSQLKLKADLVVLSACETGRGQNVRGEGIVGMTRALQYAGARSIVASQWKVADASTQTLMVAFHRKLRAGLAKDEALRQAMTVVWKNPKTAHPYYWAAFFLTGDPDNAVLGRARRSSGARVTSGAISGPSSGRTRRSRIAGATGL
jgi:CHAT domain-containing protein